MLNLPLALRAYLFLGLIEAAAAMAAYFYVLLDGGWHFGQNLAPTDPLYLRATTACLSAIIVMQIVNVFLCRSSVRSVFSIGFIDNRLILWGVLLELAFLLLINYSRLGQHDLGYRAGSARALAFHYSLGGRDARPGGGAQVAGAPVAAGCIEYPNPN